jgi:hypothetical protein
MRRNVMICTAATLTAIAALGGITAGSASAATGAPTTLTGSPNAAIAVSASPPVYVATGTGPARVCAIITAHAPALPYAKKAAEAAIAVPAPAPSGATKPALLAPAKAIALSRACPDGVCVTVVPADALRYLKGVVHAPAGFARRAMPVHCAGAKGGAGPAEITPLTSAVTCPVPGVAAPAK